MQSSRVKIDRPLPGLFFLWFYAYATCTPGSGFGPSLRFSVFRSWDSVDTRYAIHDATLCLHGLLTPTGEFNFHAVDGASAVPSSFDSGGRPIAPANSRKLLWRVVDYVRCWQLGISYICCSQAVMHQFRIVCVRPLRLASLHFSLGSFFPLSSHLFSSLPSLASPRCWSTMFTSAGFLCSFVWLRPKSSPLQDVWKSHYPL